MYCTFPDFSHDMKPLPAWRNDSPEKKLRRWSVWNTDTGRAEIELWGSPAGGAWWESGQHGRAPLSLHRKDSPRPAEPSARERKQREIGKYLHTHAPVLAHLNRENVDIEADEPARHHQHPYAGILGHQLSHCRRFHLHQLAEDLHIRLQAQHVRAVIICTYSS